MYISRGMKNHMPWAGDNSFFAPMVCVTHMNFSMHTFDQLFNSFEDHVKVRWREVSNFSGFVY
jgi:hypothetical protein